MSLAAALFVILLGPAVGSFLALLAARWPVGAPVVLARSACAACGTRLAARDLVPLLSFAVLRGRCRTCGATIPPNLLYSEILGLFAGVFAAAAGGAPAEILLSAAFLWLLLGLGLTDLLWFRLPDPLTLGVALVAAALVWRGAALATGPFAALSGAALGGCVAAALRLGYQRLRGREGMGLGDVKLIAALGVYTGPLALPSLMLVAALAGLAGALVTRRRGLSATRAIPFGTALAFAAALLWLVAALGV